MTRHPEVTQARANERFGLAKSPYRKVVALSLGRELPKPLI
jgi:hypothetical protein